MPLLRLGKSAFKKSESGPKIWPPHHSPDQGWAYRIEKLSNADISRLSAYRRVYRIKPPISSISIFSKPVIFCLFSLKIQKIPQKFRKLINQSPQQQQQRRKFQKFAENSEILPKILKICRKFWKFAENSLKRRSFLKPSYRIVSRKKPLYHIDIVSSPKKAYRSSLVKSGCCQMSQTHLQSFRDH